MQSSPFSMQRWAVLLALCGAVLASPAAAAATLAVLPADGQTVKLRLTGDQQSLKSDLNLNTLLTLQRTGDLIAVTSQPTPGTPLNGSARIVSDGSLMTEIGALAVELDAVNLASTVAVSAPDQLTLITTWNLTTPIVVAGSRVDVPMNVLVTDPSPENLAFHAQGRQTVAFQVDEKPVPGNVSIDYTVNFRNGQFSGAQGVVFADTSPTTSLHSVTNFHLAPE